MTGDGCVTPVLSFGLVLISFLDFMGTVCLLHLSAPCSIALPLRSASRGLVSARRGLVSSMHSS